MAKSKKSGLAAKIGVKGKKAVASHAGDQTEYGNVQIPGGIRNGVAKLVECKFAQYKKGEYQGEYYFLAAGTVVSPKKHDGTKVEGLRTQIMRPVCDTKKSDGSVIPIDEHIAWILNEMRKLGADTEGASPEDLESLAETLKEAGPFFKFGTSQSEPTKQYPNPRVWENWYGAEEDYEEGEEDDEIEEDEEEDEAEEDEEVEEDEEESDEEDEEEDEEEEESEEDKIREMGRLADMKKGGNAKKLAKLAKEKGLSTEDIDNADSWADLAEQLITSLSDDEEEEDEEDEDEEEDEEIVPKKGETYMYKAPRKRKAVSVTVVAVFSKSKKCNLKTDKGVTFKSVPWANLLPEE